MTIHTIRFTFRAHSNSMQEVFLLGRVRRIWLHQGRAMLAALEGASGLVFTNGAVITVGFSESDQWWSATAGRRGRRAMTLLFPKQDRADFGDMVVWLIMHELGHRLLEQHGLRHDSRGIVEDTWDEREHRLLFLFLIDALESMGEQGRRIIMRYPERGYEDEAYGHTRAWRWATGLTSQQRQKRMKQLVEHNDYTVVEE